MGKSNQKNKDPPIVIEVPELKPIEQFMGLEKTSKLVQKEVTNKLIQNEFSRLLQIS
jgi:hypothetical protein